MPKLPPLNNSQRVELRKLEEDLKGCVRTADMVNAKKIAAKLQKLLRNTGRRTRWMQDQNWLCECAIEAGDVTFAQIRLEGIRASVNDKTRCYLEATAMLAICRLRNADMEGAKPLIDFVMANIGRIKSTRRQKQFRTRFVDRVQEETILASVIEETIGELNPDQVQKEAIKLQMLDENSLLIRLGSAIPPDGLLLLKESRSHVVALLPGRERKMLPSPQAAVMPRSVGQKANDALRRVTWRAVCDPNDEIYQAWSNGLSVVYDKKWITAAIIGACKSWKITASMLITSLVALAFKMGVKTFCDAFAPDSIMIALTDKK